MSEEKKTTMPFGKHKGLLMSDVPTEYLDWLVGRDITEPLRGQIVKELSSRDEWKTGKFLEDKEAERIFEDE